jgi:DNA-binding CsgD family transcriptional regulator
MDDSERGDGPQSIPEGNEHRDDRPAGVNVTGARRKLLPAAAGPITWPLALYMLVLGFVCVLLVPLTDLWWIVPLAGLAAPVALAVLGRAQPAPHRRNDAETPAPTPPVVTATAPDAPGGTTPAVDIPAATARTTTRNTTAAPLDDPLSEREREVLAVLASGRTTSEAARDLFVSVGTIKSHAANIYRKLGARNRAEAIARARELGLLP